MRTDGLVGAHASKKWRRGRPDTGGVTDLLNRDFTAEAPNQRWVADIERHEALLDLAVVKGHRRRLVVAGRLKLRAA